MAKRPKKPPLQPGCVRTLRDLAAVSGVSYRNILEWKKRPGFPVEPDGSFHVWKVCCWRFETFDLRGKDGPSASSDDDVAELKRRKLAAEVRDEEAGAARAELKLQNELGELVLREAAADLMRQAFHGVRQRLEAVPAEIATTVPRDHRAEIVSAMKDKMRLVLKELESLREQGGGDDEP